MRSASQRCFSQTTETTVPVETARADVSNATQSSTEHNSGSGLLYDGHTPLNAWQRAAVAVGSAFGALASPERADLVAALGCARR
jgi:Coenzyme Q (ubiquinone) biosynthesis protein Coq4